VEKSDGSQEVVKAQKISRMCFGCGHDNPMGLHAQFLELQDGRLYVRFRTLDEHQSYPGRVHGGVISAILDETIGRIIQIDDPDAFSVTIELNVKFRKPVPVGVELTVVAWQTKRTSRVFEGQGELLLEDGSVAASGFARYLMQPLERITEIGLTEIEWFADPREYPTDVEV